MCASGMGVQFSDHNNRCCQKRAKLRAGGLKRGLLSTVNILKVKAALFALKSFAKVYQMTNAHVRFKIDNTPAQAYINHQGGTKSVGLLQSSLGALEVVFASSDIVSAEHLPGIHNQDADQASCIFSDRTEWMTSPLLREALSLLAVNSSTDLFASRLNKQFPVFCSWKPHPDAWKIDAFSFPWIKKVSMLSHHFAWWEKL